MPHCKQIKLTDVWRTCNKIRATIFRVGLNLWEYYSPLDPNKNCLISESKFCSVLNGPLKDVIGLSEQEIADLADYFMVQDGRILYTHFCEVIHDSVPTFSKNKTLITGLEWEDPLEVHRLSLTEERRLSVLVAKIATTVNLRKLVLKPYFQDYELVSKNAGTVSIAHFARLLAFLGLLVSDKDFNLLVKKYLKDGYTINYVAFVYAIDQMVNYMDEHGMLDVGGDLLPQFPGRLIDAELPKLPRPEIGKVLASSIFGKQSIFHPALETPRRQQELITLMRSIQKHVLENRLQISEFFQDFDTLNVGKITTSQFHRGLDAMGISGLSRIFLSLAEIQSLTVQYSDPCDPTRVCWRTFADDLDQVFTIKELEKYPCLEVNPPPREVIEIPKPGGKVWQSVNPALRDKCEEAVLAIKHRTMKRGILLKPVFRDFDSNNNGHVSRSQMRQCLSMNGILLSDEELYAIEERFNDDLGFNYFWFLREVEPKKSEEILYTGYVENMIKLNAPKSPSPAEQKETDIVLIMAKIKAKVVRERLRVMSFFTEFDRQKQEVISKHNFQRGVENCRLELTKNEIETLMEVFASPKRPEYVDYKRFANAAEEPFTQQCLERAPLLVPLQYVPSRDCEKNFLNFDERKMVAVALQKLANKPDLQTNIMSIFQDYDKTRCGTVSQEQFLKALAVRGMYNLISRLEFNVICKCFGFERGLRDEVDYRAFVKTLDIIHANNKYLPF